MTYNIWSVNVVFLLLVKVPTFMFDHTTCENELVKVFIIPRFSFYNFPLVVNAGTL